MNADTLTAPERTCTRAQTRRIRTLVVEEGGCCYCTRRSSVFEGVGRIAACGLNPPKAFPACLLGADGFDFDEPAFREGAGKTFISLDATHA